MTILNLVSTIEKEFPRPQKKSGASKEAPLWEGKEDGKVNLPIKAGRGLGCFLHCESGVSTNKDMAVLHEFSIKAFFKKEKKEEAGPELEPRLNVNLMPTA